MKGLQSLYLFMHKSMHRVQQIKLLEFASISNRCCEPPSFHDGKQPDGSNHLCKNTGAKSLWAVSFSCVSLEPGSLLVRARLHSTVPLMVRLSISGDCR